MKNKTINFYDQNAEKWRNGCINKEGSFRDMSVAKLKEFLPEGKILEIGSGPGIDAEKLVKAGFDYIGTDASEGFIELAKKLNPNINFIKMAVEELDFPKNNFDGFWTSATLLHIPKNRINIILNKIREVCKTGAIGFISLKMGETEGEEKETGRWYSFYKKDEFEKILRKNRFEEIDFKIEKDWREGRPNWLLFWVKTI